MCRHRPLTYCEIFCETGILAPVEEWGHFVAASRKIGNFDKWVVIWGVEVKDVGKVESKKISVKLVEILANLKSATPCVLLQCKTCFSYPLQ